MQWHLKTEKELSDWVDNKYNSFRKKIFIFMLCIIIVSWAYRLFQLRTGWRSHYHDPNPPRQWTEIFENLIPYFATSPLFWLPIILFTVFLFNTKKFCKSILIDRKPDFCIKCKEVRVNTSNICSVCGIDLVVLDHCTFK
jgi:hypothetical protein